MLRLAGAAAIFLACVYVGATAASAYRVRAEQLEAFKLLIGYIGGQIEAYLTPLDLIFSDYKDKRLRDCGFTAALSRGGGVFALRECRAVLRLTDGEIAELIAFFDGLGGGSASDEIRRCAYFEKRFAALAEASRAELAKRSRLYRSFGFLAGTILIVILL